MSVYMRKFTIISVLSFALLWACGIALPATAVADDSYQAGTIETHEDGWAQDDAGRWHYWQDNEMLKSQWLDSSSAETPAKPAIEGMPDAAVKFWLDANGALALNRVIDPTTAKDAGSFDLETDPGCVYVDGFGQITTGITVVGKRVYLAKASGKLETGNKYGILGSAAYNKKGEKRYYYINPKYHCAIVTAKPVKVEGFGWVFPYYKDAHLITGRKVIRPASGVIVGSKVYLARANGKLETGNIKSGGILGTSRYDKDKNGNPVKRYYYINQKHHCAIVASKPVKVANFGWVFPYDKYAHLITGRKVIKAKNTVYLARANGKLETGDKQGFLTTSYYDTNKNKRKWKYYINPKTHAITYGKPVKVANFGWVYAPNGGGFLLTECKKIDSKHMLLVEKSGKLYNKAGWVRSSIYTGWDDRFRMECVKKNGATFYGARIGDFKVNGDKYCGQSNGAVYHDQHWLSGNTYYWVNHNGKFNRDDVVTSLYRRAQGYWSPSRYLIMVDIDNPKTIVFEGWQGNWWVKYIWDCCTGHESCPTICGTFSLGAKGYSFGEGNGYSCYYYSQICGDFLFHSQLYWPYTRTIKDGTMGRRCSHGCVRLYIDNAYWIWNNVPSGTTVATVY